MRKEVLQELEKLASCGFSILRSVGCQLKLAGVYDARSLDTTEAYKHAFFLALKLASTEEEES